MIHTESEIRIRKKIAIKESKEQYSFGEIAEPLKLRTGRRKLVHVTAEPRKTTYKYRDLNTDERDESQKIAWGLIINIGNLLGNQSEVVLREAGEDSEAITARRMDQDGVSVITVQSSFINIPAGWSSAIESWTFSLDKVIHSNVEYDRVAGECAWVMEADPQDLKSLQKVLSK